MVNRTQKQFKKKFLELLNNHNKCELYRGKLGNTPRFFIRTFKSLITFFWLEAANVFELCFLVLYLQFKTCAKKLLIFFVILLILILNFIVEYKCCQLRRSVYIFFFVSQRNWFLKYKKICYQWSCGHRNSFLRIFQQSSLYLVNTFL